MVKMTYTFYCFLADKNLLLGGAQDIVTNPLCLGG